MAAPRRTATMTKVIEVVFNSQGVTKSGKFVKFVSEGDTYPHPDSPTFAEYVPIEAWKAAGEPAKITKTLTVG